MASEANRQHFVAKSVKDVMTSKTIFRKVVSVKGNVPVSKAFEKMKKHKILAIPVFAATDNKFLGFLDVFDLAIFALDITHNYQEGTATWESFLVSENQWESATCEHVLSRGHTEHPTAFAFIAPDASLVTAAGFLSDRRTHRLAVIDSEHKFLGVVSQSDILHFISGHLDHHDLYFAKSVRELGLGSSQVITISENYPVSDAFRSIQRNHVTGIGVVNAEGQLAGCVSSADIKDENSLSIDTLIAVCGHTIAFLLSQLQKKSLVTVTEADTLETILDKFKHHRVHRLFVVDEHNKPLRVISMTDVLRLFAPRSEQAEPTKQ